MNPSIAKLILTTALAFFAGCSAENKYEVIERTQRNNVPDFRGTGTHTAVDYILSHDGHKIYAHCDTTDISNLDPTATCALLTLRTYACVVPSDNLEKASYPLSDLECKDGAGHNVYLYVSKEE
jgi:hypothetical protein